MIGLVNGFDGIFPQMLGTDGTTEDRMQQRINKLGLPASGLIFSGHKGGLDVVGRDRL